MACAPARRIRCGSVARDARLAEITRARNIEQKLTTRMPIVQISGAGYEKVLKRLSYTVCRHFCFAYLLT